jgi:hypothetical protein
VLSQPSDSGMIRVDEDTGLGVAVSTDCNGRFAKLDPYAGAQLALAESYRNVATGGATPLAISDCLNFGSPEDPAVMWQFAEACRGLEGRVPELGIPVTGGNVRSTTRPARPRSCRRQWLRCWALSTTYAAVRPPDSWRRISRSCCWARRGRSSAARSGRTSCTRTSVTMAGALGVPARVIGRTGGNELVVENQFGIGLDELRATWAATLPNALA